MKRQSEFSGVLPLLKPPGPTSHDAVQIARRALKEKQIGHTGTLDPAAGGVLVLCVGAYTKLVPYLTECDKTYRGCLALGIETTTDDSEGEAVSVSDPTAITEQALTEAAARFTGSFQQMPPRYAAIKVGGKKLYEYAREGKEVAVEPRSVTVHRFDILGIRKLPVPAHLAAHMAAQPSTGVSLPSELLEVQFCTRVSVGTYVRALARDLGRELGCGGYLLSLWRESVGHITDSQSMPLQDLEKDPGLAEDYVLHGAAALDSSRFPLLVLSRAYLPRLLSGQPIHEKMMDNANVAAAVPSGSVCAVADDTGCLFAMMQAERFDSQRRANAYDSRFEVHFKPLRIFPDGLA